MRLVTALLIVLVAIPGYGMPESMVAQTSEQLGSGDNLNCPSFLSVAEGGEQHMLAVYDADRTDPYHLDSDAQGRSGVPCEDRTRLGTEARTSCLSFLPSEQGGQGHAQALYEAALPGDPYGLDANGDGRACFVETAQETPSAPSAPSTAGCAIFAEVAHASACAGGPVGVVADPENEDTIPVATSNGISTGALFSTTQRTGGHGTRIGESEQQAKRKAKKREQRKAKRLKQRQLKRQRQEQRSGQR